jgi:hypothetical protein
VHGLAPGNSQPMLVCIAEASARPAELILKNADCSPELAAKRKHRNCRRQPGARLGIAILIAACLYHWTTTGTGSEAMPLAIT